MRWCIFLKKLTTLQETNSLHLKMVVPYRNLLFQRSIFRCYVSFRECISSLTTNNLHLPGGRAQKGNSDIVLQVPVDTFPSPQLIVRELGNPQESLGIMIFFLSPQLSAIQKRFHRLLREKRNHSPSPVPSSSIIHPGN